jgi:insulysin
LSPEETAALHLPDKNEFLPDSLDVDRVQVENVSDKILTRVETNIFQPLKAPEIVKSTERYIVWHKKDDQFWHPRGSVTVKIQR